MAAIVPVPAFPPASGTPSDAVSNGHRRARATLAVGLGLGVAGVALLLAVIGLAVDHRIVTGVPAWLKPATFGISIPIYLITLRWIIGFVRGHARLLAALSAVVVVALTLEIVWIWGQALRGTTSHFNQGTLGDAIAYFAAGGAISTVFVATMVVGVLVLRRHDLDAGLAAGLRWGIAMAGLGMAEAVTMIVNHSVSSTGGHTVGAPDGGPGLPVTDWSLLHGDLRIGHFVGLHALQVLPLIAWALARLTPLDARTRARLVRIAGLGMAGLVLLTTWQAERGQALLRPDGSTLAAAAVLVVLIGVAVLIALNRRPGHGRRRITPRYA